MKKIQFEKKLSSVSDGTTSFFWYASDLHETFFPRGNAHSQVDMRTLFKTQ